MVKQKRQDSSAKQTGRERSSQPIKGEDKMSHLLISRFLTLRQSLSSNQEHLSMADYFFKDYLYCILSAKLDI